MKVEVYNIIYWVLFLMFSCVFGKTETETNRACFESFFMLLKNGNHEYGDDNGFYHFNDHLGPETLDGIVTVFCLPHTPIGFAIYTCHLCTLYMCV